MLKMLGLVIIAGVVGYMVGLFGGMFLVDAFSTNTHDKALEAAMTGAFVIGPGIAAGAILGVIIYYKR